MKLSPGRYRSIAIAALAALAAIIVTGAAVRLTNSGLGCDDWPNCSSTKLIDVSSKHAAIEQINRLFTGVVAVSVIAAVLGSVVRTPRRRDLMRLSLFLVAGVLGNAVLGGVTVLVGLHPLAVQGHMLLSMSLIVGGTMLVRRSGEPDDVPRVPAVSSVSARLLAVHFAVVCLAIYSGTFVTGAGPHGGTEEVIRFGIAIPTIARIHGALVITSILLALAIAWRIRVNARDRAVLVGPLSTWIFVAALQGALGYVQYFNGVPELLVGLHVAGATAVMLVSTQLLLHTTAPTDGGRSETDRPVSRLANAVPISAG